MMAPQHTPETAGHPDNFTLYNAEPPDFAARCDTGNI